VDAQEMKRLQVVDFKSLVKRREIWKVIGTVALPTMWGSQRREIQDEGDGREVNTRELASTS
jgi:hypothetical protein